jgi:hypothetical protein
MRLAKTTRIGPQRKATAPGQILHQLSTRFSETGAFFAPRLINPAVDAKAVAATLKRLGFELAEGYELAFQQMRSILSQFSAALPDAKGAVVYHAGHGVAIEDDYLLATDIDLKTPTDLDLPAVNASPIWSLRRPARAPSLSRLAPRTDRRLIPWESAQRSNLLADYQAI